MSETQLERVQLEVVIPVFNEIEIMEQLHSRVVGSCEKTGCSYRIIYVDDGSHDGTADWILQHAINQNGLGSIRSDFDESFSNSNPRRETETEIHQIFSPKVTLLQLSRNFGQPSAILAGLKHSTAGSVVIMDGDLQDPPELIPEMVEQWQSGDQVVIAQRTGRKESFARGLAFKTFHSWFRYLSDSEIPPNTGTFCLLDRVAADSIRELPESHRFLPGLRAWIGYRQSMVQYERPPRAAGEPKQTFVRLFSYALDAIFGFSYKPLRLLTGLGTGVCCVAFLLAAWFLFKRVVGWETASIGFTTLTCSIFCLCGFQLIGMGILGEYIGRIYDEVKRRPQFIVAKQSHSEQVKHQRGIERSERGSSRLVG